MRIIKFVFLVLIILLLTACVESKKEVETVVVKDPSGIEFMSNQLLIYFDNNVTKEEIDLIKTDLNATTDDSTLNEINLYMFTLKYKSFSTLDELKKYCNEISNKYKNITNCYANTIMYIED